MMLYEIINANDDMNYNVAVHFIVLTLVLRCTIELQYIYLYNLKQ